MGSGLYEAAFASLIRLYGRDSRSAITGFPLFAGFASTIGWPLPTLLKAQCAWRGTCLGWAALHVCLGLPLNALLARAAAVAGKSEPAVEVASSTSTSSSPFKTPVLLSIVFATTGSISTADGSAFIQTADGTWAEARKMFRNSPYLDRFPVLNLELDRSSHYQLRHSGRTDLLCPSEVAAKCMHLAGEHVVKQTLEAYLDVFTHHYLRAKNQQPVEWESGAHQRLRGASGQGELEVLRV